MGEAKVGGDLAVDSPSDPGSAAIERAVARTVAMLRRQRSSLSGEDSGLGNVWLEFCVQVQGEQSVDWDYFELEVRQNIEAVLFSMTSNDRKVIWLRTPAGEDWDEQEHAGEVQIPADDEDLIEAVYGKVWQLAADLEDERVERYLHWGGDRFDEDDDADEDADKDEEAVGAGPAGERP